MSRGSPSQGQSRTLLHDPRPTNPFCTAGLISQGCGGGQKGWSGLPPETLWPRRTQRTTLGAIPKPEPQGSHGAFCGHSGDCSCRWGSRGRWLRAQRSEAEAVWSLLLNSNCSFLVKGGSCVLPGLLGQAPGCVACPSGPPPLGPPACPQLCPLPLALTAGFSGSAFGLCPGGPPGREGEAVAQGRSSCLGGQKLPASTPASLRGMGQAGGDGKGLGSSCQPEWAMLTSGRPMALNQG